MYTNRELKEYDEYCKGEPVFPWLSELEAYLTSYYGVDFMPTLYEKVYLKNPNCISHIITPMVLSQEEEDKIYTHTFSELSEHAYEHELNVIRKKVYELSNKYGIPVLESKDNIRVLRIYPYLYLYRSYHFPQIAFEHKHEMQPFFEHLNPISVHIGLVSSCVLNSKKEARKFLLSNDYKEIRKRIFNILKAYDEYNVLRESDVRIFVDYKENFERTPMHGRWVGDLNQSEWEKYEKSIIE